MTSKKWDKTMEQLEFKPAKKKRFLKFNKPKKRTFGAGTKVCKICGRHGAHIGKYSLHVCRQCFRELAGKLGFKKYGHEV